METKKKKLEWTSNELTETDSGNSESDTEEFRRKLLRQMQQAIDEIEEHGIEEGMDPQELVELENMRKHVKTEKEHSHD